MKWIVATVLVVVVAATSAHAFMQEDLDRLRKTTSCENCDLSGANLRNADLILANLRGANLFKANLSGANLLKANLIGANLTWANLREASLSGAYLLGANLNLADLGKANLTVADLVGANLTGADLRGADLSLADLSEAKLLSATGLSVLQWTRLPHGIYGVREVLKRRGERGAERQLTYSIMRNRRVNAGGLEGAFNYVLFEITSDYGMTPDRPLLIMIALIFVFSLAYRVGLNTGADSGIWKLWSDERVLKSRGSEEPERLAAGPWVKWAWAIYFSVLSAFHIGWRDLNVSNWIARTQPREFTLRATGWVRTVSGIQSLISVYLVALSVLTYFGRPFG